MRSGVGGGQGEGPEGAMEAEMEEIKDLHFESFSIYTLTG